jgi:hypothetical protein
MLMMLFALAAQAQLRLVPGALPQAVFGGKPRNVEVRWCNPGGAAVSSEIGIRLLQASSATAVPLAVTQWKNLSVLPGQTVLESAQLNFPAVKAKTEFIVQWLAETNRVLGVTRVMVYPTNLLNELRALLGEGRLGVLDPDGMLKPLLKQKGVQYSDLEEMPLKDFHGRLAIIGPMQTNAQMRVGLAESVKAMTKNGTAVLWFLTSPEKREQLLPSFYTVTEGTNSVVVAHAMMISNILDSPLAQLNLVALCKQALVTGRPELPDLTCN